MIIILIRVSVSLYVRSNCCVLKKNKKSCSLMQERGLSIRRTLCLHPRQFSICNPALLLQRLKYFCLVSGQEASIFSDWWRSSGCLQDEDYNHLTVNHQESFVDPVKGAHIQHPERLWGVCTSNKIYTDTKYIEISLRCNWMDLLPRWTSWNTFAW